MLELRTLGTMDLRRCDGDQVTAVLAQPKRFALLAYLAIARPRGFHSKDQLRALFWPDADDHHARLDLNRAVYFLRHTLGEDVVATGPGETLGVGRAALWCDAAAFDEALDAGRLEEALELYRGDLLAGFFASVAPEFEHWLDREREHVRKRAVAATLALAQREADGGHLADAVRWATRAREISPYAEAATRRLIGLLDRMGDRAEAVRVYDEFVRRLDADLEVAPSPETRALIETIRARTAPTVLAPGIPQPESARQARARLPAARVRRTVPVALAVAFGLGTWGLWRPWAQSAPTATVRIAVIPIASVGPNGTEYLGVGVTEELVTHLSKVPGLAVIAPVSASRSAEQATRDVRRFARELDVRAVVQGSITESRGRVRINARLLDARAEEVLWAEAFDLPLGDILEVQGDIARRISEALALEVGDETALPRRAPRRPEAYVAYLKGRYFLNRRTEDGLTKAIAYFQEAVAWDSTYALGYAGLADAHALVSAYGGTRAWTPGKAFALRAVTLDSTLAEARLSLALFRHMQDWDWDGAAREYEHAIRLDPRHAPARQWYALLLRDLGWLDVAELELRRALELDPLSPAISRNLGYVLLSAGRHDEAIQQFQRTLELDPAFPLVHEWLRNAYAEAHRFDEAFAQQIAVAARQGWTSDALSALREAFAARGWTGVLERMLARAVDASSRQYISPAVLAARHAQLGHADEAFRQLERAYRDRDPGLLNIRTNPLYRGLRADRRFRELQRRMGLPE